MMEIVGAPRAELCAPLGMCFLALPTRFHMVSRSVHPYSAIVLSDSACPPTLSMTIQSWRSDREFHDMNAPLATRKPHQKLSQTTLFEPKSKSKPESTLDHTVADAPGSWNGTCIKMNLICPHVSKHRTNHGGIAASLQHDRHVLANGDVCQV